MPFLYQTSRGQPHVHSKARMLSAKPVNWQEPITQSELKDILNSHQNRSKNKLIGKNAMTPGHGLLLAKCQVEVGRGCSLFYEQKL